MVIIAWTRIYITSAFSGVPRRGDKIKRGYFTPAFSGAQKWVESLHTPSALGGAHKRGKTHKWLHHPCLLRGPKAGGIGTLALQTRGPPSGQNC